MSPVWLTGHQWVCERGPPSPSRVAQGQLWVLSEEDSGEVAELCVCGVCVHGCMCRGPWWVPLPGASFHLQQRWRWVCGSRARAPGGEAAGQRHVLEGK